MITKVKYTDLTSTQVKITLDDGREMFAGVEGSTWMHAELNEWLKDNTPEPWKTEQELIQYEQEQARNEFKKDRETNVASIKVTVDNMVFDGDETSQARMAKAIVSMEDNETTLWVLADNTQIQATKAQLKQALRLAGEEQTRLWI